MICHVLLLSHDEQLAKRVARSLPAAPAVELHWGASYRPCDDHRGWLLLLVDALILNSGDSADPPASQAAALPPLDGEMGPTPVLWLGEPPVISSQSGILANPGRSPLGNQPVCVIDFLNRGLAPSTLGFILYQHLTTAYLHRVRTPPRLRHPDWDDAEVLRQINNTLAGILGNAELAMDRGRKLPPQLGQRLRRIAELAAEMRDLVSAIPEARQGRRSAA